MPGEAALARRIARIWLYRRRLSRRTVATERSTLTVNDRTVTEATLAAFSDAWNRYDIDTLMAFMHDDCIFQTAAGNEACGMRHVGRSAVRGAFAAAWQTVADAQWRNGRHHVAGDFGVSEWTFTGTAADGTRIETDGVDIFTFKDGRILVKNAFRKTRPNLPAAK